jgi:MHS family proline/betaine transporter-like MFS transporter
MEALVAATKNSLVPAFWIIGTSVAGFIAVVFLRESARRPLMGSMPAVATPEEAHELVKTQDTNPDLHLDLLFEPAPTPGEGVRMVGVGAGN